ncbi:MAG TPA: SDR family NAD(P)-dependent oxidoreductase, partial [Lentisphaeria bacterium]|nr:SDR family NAD(P)-dependent oxidoreductase [Lentisphaeria bacterium]
MALESGEARRVLVTGGAVRIGQAIVRAFAAAGYRVVIHYRRSEDAAQALLAELGGVQAGHCAVQADLLDYEQVAGLLPAVICSGGPVSVLVNSAAVYSRRPLAETDARFL